MIVTPQICSKQSIWAYVPPNEKKHSFNMPLRPNCLAFHCISIMDHASLKTTMEGHPRLKSGDNKVVQTDIDGFKMGERWRMDSGDVSRLETLAEEHPRR
jgi:hypothetical protein